jgi:hypothetical protein
MGVLVSKRSRTSFFLCWKVVKMNGTYVWKQVRGSMICQHNSGASPPPFFFSLPFFSSFFLVPLPQTHFFSHALPDFIQEKIEVEVPLARDDDRVREPGHPVDLLDRENVALVVDVEAPEVLAVALDHVNQLVDRGVLPDHYLAVVDLVPGGHTIATKKHTDTNIYIYQ